MPAPKLQGISPAVLKLLSVDETSGSRRNYTFEAKCKDYANNISLTPRLCLQEKAWKGG